jgi:Spy/CpxP family protein refolding chaperone
MKLPLPVLIFALFATAVSAVAAARPDWGPGLGHDSTLFFLDAMAEQTGLTEDQEASINELISASKLESAVDRERMSQIREELQRLARADQAFDDAAATRLADELAEIVARTAVSHSELGWQIRQALTEEQREQLDQLFSGHRRPHERFNFLNSPTE